MERKLSKVYLEITNVCNAECSFCPGHKREPRFLSRDEFSFLLDRLEGRAEQLFFHLMGEPLLHSDVRDFAALASSRGFKVMITTNGLLASQVGEELVADGNIHRISISLHSHEANPIGLSLNNYLQNCFSLARKASEAGSYAVLRLWNTEGGEGYESDFNRSVFSSALEFFGCEPVKTRSGFRVYDRVFIEYGERFEWPVQSKTVSNEVFCYGLRDQIGVLCDGTVVPCCLDSEGNIPLGNLFADTLEAILCSDRAKAMYDGFTSHTPSEPLCKSCGFARRFSTKG